jgi:hypothetical protein
VLHLAPVPYTCVGVGKWHLADVDQLQLNPTHPLGQPLGRWFDRYAGAMFNLQQAVPGSSQSIYFSWIKQLRLVHRRRRESLPQRTAALRRSDRLARR